MIDNLEERSDFWTEHYFEECQGRTTTEYLDRNLALFKDKSVLEIGPGEGRQFKKVNNLASEYAIGDISGTVLKYEKYNDIEYKYLIDSYDDSLEKEFDIIHFWFVVHHIRLRELPYFFKFIHFNLKEFGLILFNAPNILDNKHKSSIENDGMKTSPITDDMILENTKELFEIIEVFNGESYEERRNTTYLMKRINDI